MTNKCEFLMRVKGNADNLGELYKIMSLTHPKKLGFFNLSNISTDGKHTKCEDNNIIVSISGDCQESLYASMLEGHESSFNLYIREGEFTKDFVGTHLIRESKRLNLEVEIYSVQHGDDFEDNFEEHYHIQNGETLISEFNYFENQEDEGNGKMKESTFLMSKSFNI